MRRTAWILAALGLVGSTLNAQDDPWDSFLPKTNKAKVQAKAEAETPRKAPASAARASESKNYYEELFGGAPLAESQRDAESPMTPSNGLQTSKALKEKTRRSVGENPLAETSKHPASRTMRSMKSISPFMAEDPAAASEPVASEKPPEQSTDQGWAEPQASTDWASQPASATPPGEEELDRFVQQAEARRDDADDEKDSIVPVSGPFPEHLGAEEPSPTANRPRKTIARPEIRRRSAASLTDSISIGGPSTPEAPPAKEDEEDLPELDFSDVAPAKEAFSQSATKTKKTQSFPADLSVDDAEAQAPEENAKQRRVIENPFARPKSEDTPVLEQAAAIDHSTIAPVQTLPTPMEAVPAVTNAVASARPAATGGVTAEWVKKSDITIGRECSCDLVIRNQTGTDVADVEVTATLPATVDLVGAEPSPSGNGSLAWNLGALSAGESRTISIRMIPRERGRMDTQAFVRFSNAATESFSVAEPLLALELSGPEEVMVGDSASHTLTIRNPGTGVATNVRVEALIPEGLEHARGKRLVMDLGALNPGESRPVRLALAAISGGHHTVEVKAQADGNLQQVAASEIAVVAPRLNATIDGPQLRYLGRQAVYTLTVANAGGAATDNVRVMHKIPEGFEFVSCDKGGRYDVSTRLLNWFVGALGENESAEAHVTLKANEGGAFTHYVRATSEHGIVSDAQVSTQVEATASLVLRVTDLDDPVETGVETAYEVRVTNEGTAPAMGIALSCELPEQVTFSSATGPSDHQMKGKDVVFQPINQLAPGESAKFQVFVKGTAAGNMRFRANLTSQSVTDPLTAEELTKVYGE